MKKKILKLLNKILEFLPILISILFILAIVGLEIYVFATYGNKPISEIPFWAIWLMFGVKK